MIKVQDRSTYGTRPVNGSTQNGAATKRVSISFDDRIFDRIKSASEADGVSFNTACRRFIRAGISAMKDKDARQ